MPIITLTTDFGLDDSYVAVMKGVILNINPQATVVDICHTVAPQNVAEGAYILGTAHAYFPSGTVHVAVVDPGVGTERRAVLLATPDAFFLSPDNGVLGYIAARFPEAEAFELTNSRFWLSPLSATFHGRDIFAPVAAHLSSGVPPRELGEPISALTTVALPRPQLGEDGVLIGRVIHIDRFGNLVTDVESGDLPDGRLFVEVDGHIIDDLSTSYEAGYDEESELLAILGSDGKLEVSVHRGSAANFLRAKVGDVVKVGINKTSVKGRLR